MYSKMVYIRSKKVKGENYLYLVKSEWDSKQSTSRQKIVKYLGNASTVTTNDIPENYRNDPKIVSFLTSKTGEGIKKKEKLIVKFRKELYNHLSNGDFQASLNLYKIYQKNMGTTDFFDCILTPVMYQVGDLWEKNKISISTEHVCSNIAHSIVNVIMEKNSVPRTKQKILICTPNGEQHHLGCQILESYLSCKGYNVSNLSPSAPSESILESIKKIKPDAVLVSITLQDNIKVAQRLVKKIREQYDSPIFIGGQALFVGNTAFDGTIIKEQSLDEISKTIKNELRG
ncbi:MAG TPA: cobalamin-dependent protein [Nitrosopumilaceae archaeon]|nr:cobalamin-dependent protein [Nitrosopumilaceae archaeon]